MLVTDATCKIQLSFLQQQTGLGRRWCWSFSGEESCWVMDSEISFVPSSQSGLCLLQLLVLGEECITQRKVSAAG